MAQKIAQLDGVGQITLQKRRNTRSIRIHIRGNDVKIVMPGWVPYAQGLAYGIHKKDWIKANIKPVSDLAHGSYIGKKHQLFVTSTLATKNQTKILNGRISVKLSQSQKNRQNTVEKAVEKALANECQELIEPRVSDLAYDTGINYLSVKFKKLKSRWGSCDSKGNITLNIFLVQLDWKLIDYVILHELAHVTHQNHSSNFWSLVEHHMPDYKQRRRELKKHSPSIITF